MCVVVLIQIFLLSMVEYVVLGFAGPTKISMPKSVQILVLRFISTLLIHLQVEGDVTQGLRMMKYAVNHMDEFSAPISAFFIGFMQFITGLGTEYVCVLHLSTLNAEFKIMVHYMPLRLISMVDNLYANSLGWENSIKGQSKPLKVKNFRR